MKKLYIIFQKSLERYFECVAVNRKTQKINQNLMKFEIISLENLKFVDIQKINTVDVMLNYN